MRVEQLENSVRKVLSSVNNKESLNNFVSFIGRGNIYKFSPENIALLYAQKPDAEFVQTFDKVHDGARIEYLKQYIKQFKRACDDGIDGKGYFVWSFMDNFEWSKAYSRRFGLVYINYQTLKRTKKDSFYYYHDVVTSNGEKL